MTSPQIQAATEIAFIKHVGQTRKYDGAPYFTHVERVARLAEAHGLSDNQIAAAYLHDVLEDTPTTADELRQILIDSDVSGLDAAIIVSLVVQLTDVYVLKRYPNHNRKARKALESERLSQISREAKLIKLCDLIDNTSDIVGQDKGFAVVYLREKQTILAGFGDVAETELYQLALDNASFKLTTWF